MKSLFRTGLGPLWIATVCLAAHLTPAALNAGDWTSYRGPTHNGVSTEPIRTNWSQEPPRQLWKVPLNPGLSSFTVSGGRLFTQVRTPGSQPTTEYCVALNADTGGQLWISAALDVADYPNGGVGDGHDDGPRSTPVVDGDRVYVLTLYLKLYCLNAANGQEVWSKDLVAQYGGTVIPWQNAASPLIEGDFILVNCNASNQRLLALRKQDGSEAWKGQDDRMTQATPVAASIAGVRQVVFFAQSGLVSVAPADGSVLWRYPFSYTVSSGASPVVGNDIVYCSAAYGMGAGATRITATGSPLTSTQVWRKNGANMNHWATPVHRNGYLFGVYGQESSGATLRCIDLANGDEKWQGSTPVGMGAVLLVSGYLLVLTADGYLLLAQPDPAQYVEIASYRALDGSQSSIPGLGVRCWNVPAISNGRIYLRSSTEAVALDVAPLTLDVTPPALASSVPVNGAGNVPLDSTVVFTFNEAMRVPSDYSQAITWSDVGPLIPASFNYSWSGDGTTLTCAYSGPLPATDTISWTLNAAGFLDLAGNPLSPNLPTGSFTTADPADTAPPALASSVPVNGAGNVPLDSTVVFTFNEAMRVPSDYSQAITWSDVGPLIPASFNYSWSGDGTTLTCAYSGPLPATDTISWTLNAAGFLDLAGNPLSPNLPTGSFTTADPADTAPPALASSVPVNGAGNVPLDSTVVFTFNEAMRVPSDYSQAITWSDVGPLIPASFNYSWSGDGTTLTCAYSGPLPATDTISWTLNAAGFLDLAGNPLSPNLPTGSFTTADPADTAPPALASSVPVNGAGNVPLDSTVVFTFNEAMRVPSDYSQAITWSDVGPLIPASFNYSWSGDGTTLTCAYSGPLPATDTISWTLNAAGFLDLAGNPLSPNLPTGSFTTADPADTAPPALASSVPVNGAGNVPLDSTVVFTFNEAMRVPSDYSQAITWSDVGPLIPASFNYSWSGDGTTLTCAYSGPLPATDTISWTLNAAGFLDLAGNPLSPNLPTGSFTTADPADTAPPALASSVPVNGAGNVPLDSTVVFTFNEAMRVPSDYSQAITWSDVGPLIPASFNYSWSGDGTTLTCAYSGPLPATDTISWTLNAAGFLDLAGNPLSPNLPTGSFTTADPADTAPPALASSVPVNGAGNVPLDSTVVFTFNEAMRVPSDYSQAITWSDVGPLIPASFNYSWSGDGTTLTCAYSGPLPATDTISWTLNAAGFLDLAGNPLSPNLPTGSFTTADPAPPRLILNPTLTSIDGGFRLLLGNEDSSPLDSNRVARIDVFATSDLVPGLGSWTKLTNSAVLTNGQLMIDDAGGGLPPGRFFRAEERP